MRRLWILSALALSLALCAPGTLAGAEQDLTIDKREDDDKNEVYYLVNTGQRPIKATVEFTKTCHSQTRRPHPKQTTVRSEPGKPLRLGRSWLHSDCEHRYRVTRAEYL